MQEQEQDSRWQRNVTLAQVWISGLGICLTIVGGVTATWVTTRDAIKRLEWQVERNSAVLVELQTGKAVQLLASEVRSAQNRLAAIELRLAAMGRRR